MIRRVVLICCIIIFAYALFAQTSTPPPAATGKAAETKKSKPEKAIPTEFSDEVAKQVLGQIRQALLGHNPRQMLAVFDKEKMDGYYVFQDRLYGYFAQYQDFRAYFRLLQTSEEGGHEAAIAEWQIEETPQSGLPVRREGQVRFEFAAGKKGWKIVNFTPRDFFQ
ncbi:MAG: hypothetical protein ROO76_22475 [Terriglobia bacterium]|jgi:hypothetical protein|nr:hypothetical protein [Terriglobia bacterium]